MCGLKFPTDSNLIVGLDIADDAGVYKITDEIAIIQTVDFFTPIVDDPYCFGQIAAANALSDVYAMGGMPKTAMNIVCFPSKTMELSVLRSILEGGIHKMEEAGVVVIGGHSFDDNELKYGLSVTGFINPDLIITKKNLKKGDGLVLTKPLGAGIINTAIKAGLASEKIIKFLTNLMVFLNKSAAEVMKDYPVHACTDITGFGFLGHLAEMVVDSGYGVKIYADKMPVIPEAYEYARMGLIPAGAYKNRQFREAMIEFDPSVKRVVQDILFDPQTSGGLLISLPLEYKNKIIDKLHSSGLIRASHIGNFLNKGRGEIFVKNN